VSRPTDDQLYELAERQHGLVARYQLHDLPPTRQAMHQRLHTSKWEHVTDHVARLRGSPRTKGQKVLAAVLDAGRDAALSHQSSGSWWGLAGCSLEPLHVTTTSRSSRSTSLALLHVVRELPEQWVTQLDGVPVVRPELLALQLFGALREERAERLVESLWSMRLLSGPSIERFIDEMGRRGRNGTAGLRRYLAARGPDYVPPASNVEARAIQVLREWGFHFRRQVDSGGDRWTGRVDLRHATLPLIVEIQSERYHSALVDQLADRRRIAELEAAGFVVIEVTDLQVWTRPRELVEAVREGILEARRRAAA